MFFYSTSRYDNERVKEVERVIMTIHKWFSKLRNVGCFSTEMTRFSPATVFSFLRIQQRFLAYMRLSYFYKNLFLEKENLLPFFFLPNPAHSS